MKIVTSVVGEIATNCYLLIDEATQDAAIIDPGAEADTIQQMLRRENVTPRYILLTHGHFDHTTAAPELHRVFPQAEVFIHSADANGTGSYVLPLAGKIDGLRYCSEGDAIPFGNGTIKVLHTPGHTEGSVIYVFEDALFCGDTLFAGSCGRTDLPGGNSRKMLESLRRLALLDGDYRVYPGHMESSTLDTERKTNPFMLQATR